MDDNFTRFYEKAFPEPNSGCWLWTGTICRGNAGYGQFREGGKCVYAHRISFEIHKGSIPLGMDVCHLCDVPSCVNPDHLFIGTRSDNMRDCVRKGRFADAAKASITKMQINRCKQELKTRCPQDHPYDEENTYVTPDGKRQCRKCRYYAKMRYKNGR